MKKERYTGTYELERKTKSEAWAVHKIYAKKVCFLNATTICLSFSEISEKKRGQALSYKIHRAHGIKQVLGQRYKRHHVITRGPAQLSRLGYSHGDLEPKS